MSQNCNSNQGYTCSCADAGNGTLLALSSSGSVGQVRAPALVARLGERSVFKSVKVKPVSGPHRPFQKKAALAGHRPPLVDACSRCYTAAMTLTFQKGSFHDQQMQPGLTKGDMCVWSQRDGVFEKFHPFFCGTAFVQNTLKVS